MKTSDWTVYDPPRNHQAPEGFDRQRYEVEFQQRRSSGSWAALEPSLTPGWFSTLRYRYRPKTPAASRDVSLPEDERREDYAMADGLLDYFPNALAEVAAHSKRAMKQHGLTEFKWHRGKSTDHRNKIIRHVIDAGKFDDRGNRHSVALVWRALALLQEELERDEGYPLPRGAVE